MGLRAYTVTAVISASVFTRVKARSKKHAIELANMERSAPGLCHQCTGAGDPKEEWALSDGLDGEAHGLTAELDEEGAE